MLVQYFSSLERLRLAHDAYNNTSNSRLRSQYTKRPSTSHALSLRKPSVSSASSSDRSFSVTSLPPQSSRSRLRKASKSIHSPATVHIDPWEFASLPPAVQRKHFSPEEQYYIASQLNLVLLDAADEAIYKEYRQRSKSTVSCSQESGSEDLYQEDALFEERDEYDMDAQDLESFRWLDEDTDLDLRLDDYHAFTSDSNKDSNASLHHRSFRRGFSFSNVSFRRRSSSSSSLASHTLGGSVKTLTATPPLLQSQPSGKLSTAAVDPSTTHYQDPTAKMKLRVYLASPQKFDEALEFGFPSLQKDTVQSPARPRTSPGHINGQPKTFFADDTPSLSGDDSLDEKSEYLDHDDPSTPVDPGHPVYRTVHKPSIDRPAPIRPRFVATPIDNYTHAPAADREMTLRMTLTRPELRALEQTDHHKPVRVNDQPLEKAPLTTPFTNQRSIWDEIPDEPSRFKRLCMKLKGQSRSS